MPASIIRKKIKIRACLLIRLNNVTSETIYHMLSQIEAFRKEHWFYPVI